MKEQHLQSRHNGRGYRVVERVAMEKCAAYMVQSPKPEQPNQVWRQWPYPPLSEADRVCSLPVFPQMRCLRDCDEKERVWQHSADRADEPAEIRYGFT